MPLLFSGFSWGDTESPPMVAGHTCTGVPIADSALFFSTKHSQRRRVFTVIAYTFHV